MATDTEQTPSSFVKRIPVWASWTIGGVLLAAIITFAFFVAAMPQSEGTTTTSPTATPSSRPTPTPSATESASPSASPTLAPEQPPVEFDDVVEPLPGVSVTIEGLEAIEGEARGPGEVSGPSLRVTIVFTNTTGASVDLSTTVVNAYYTGDQIPASELSEPGGSPLPLEVAANSTATGVYIFSVPLDSRDIVRVTVDYSVGVPVVVFEGSAPR